MIPEGSQKSKIIIYGQKTKCSYMLTDATQVLIITILVSDFGMTTNLRQVFFR